MIEIDANFKKLEKRLRSMKKRGEDLEPVFKEIGDLIVDSIDENFSEEGRHSGDPDSIFGGSEKWEDWSQKWADRREAMGKTGKILTLDGGLVSSVDYDTSKDEIVVSSGKKYASRQHHGGGGIPARPFLVIQEEDLDEMLEDLSKFIVRGKK